jgi:hypothetical protein
VPPDPVSFVGQRSTGTGDRHRGNSEECDNEVVEVEGSGSSDSAKPILCLSERNEDTAWKSEECDDEVVEVEASGSSDSAKPILRLSERNEEDTTSTP